MHRCSDTVIGATRDFYVREYDLVRQAQAKQSRENQERLAASIRKKYGRVLKVIPYYPDSIKHKAIEKKLGMTDNQVTSALTALDNAGALLIHMDGAGISRLKEDLSNVY